ncbi:hypothetical protein KI387_015901, partial [Taxus chinensis]
GRKLFSVAFVSCAVYSGDRGAVFDILVVYDVRICSGGVDGTGESVHNGLSASVAGDGALAFCGGEAHDSSAS